MKVHRKQMARRRKMTEHLRKMRWLLRQYRQVRLWQWIIPEVPVEIRMHPETGDRQ